MSNPTQQILRPLLSCALLLGVGVQVAFAQDTASTPRTERTTVTNPGPIVPFLEGTDVFFSLKEDTIFEADILPHLIAYQNFDDVLNIDTQRAKGGKVKQFAIAVSGTPGVRLRMFESVSSPVRTPSYMPRGDFQLLWARNVAPFVQELTGRPTDNQVSIWEGHAVVGHHSNGQDGCFWQDEQRIDEVCVIVAPVEGDRQVNKHDGSFSTNYVRFGMNYSRNILDENLWARREWGFKVDVEYHPRAWVDDQVVDIYGRTRFKFGGTIASREVSWCPKRIEGKGGLEAIVGHPDSVWPVAVMAQFTCFPTPRGGWGFFVRYYGGQDYYNLGLLDNIQRVQVGATFYQSAFFRFRRAAAGN
jgi:hypothetical protein